MGIYSFDEQLVPPHPQEVFLPFSVGLLLHEPPENRPFFLHKSRIDMAATNRATSATTSIINFTATILFVFSY